MAKEDIFSKINLKDYNNILENILEQKAFTEDVKNLLLSMLYKIENGYEDYEKVKVNVNSKKYFLKQIVKIIKEECKEIELIKPLSEESKILEEKNVNYIVDKEKRKIIVYPNERMILEALITLNQTEILIEEQYELFKIGMQEVLIKGNRMNYAETIRDFNGWSWDITTSQMESKNINVVYQNLLMLVGNEFLQSWITGKESITEEEEIDLPNNEILRSKYNENFGITKEDIQEDKKVDYIEKIYNKMNKKYGEENTKKYMTQLVKTVIAIGSNNNEEQRKIVLEKQTEIEQRLEKMQDNRKYLEEISNNKKEISKKIKQIDTILNDEKILKEEYIKRNSKLPNKQKIFSVSHLKIMLEKERKKHLETIKEYNKQIEPKVFVKTKQLLEEEFEFFKDIGVEEKNKVKEEKQIKELQAKFLECFLDKIKKAETKKEISELIYELRYYKHLPFSETNLGQIKQFEKRLQEIEKILIKKACEAKLIKLFSQNEMLNKDILKNQFESKIINLENSVYILKYHKGVLKIEIYDTNIEEETKEIEIKEKVELQVKLNKKIKVWE